MADSTILPGVRARLVAPDGTTTREFYRFFSALSVTASLPGRVDDLTVRVDDLDVRVDALEHGGGAVRTILGLQSVKVVGPLEDGSVQLSLAGDVISAPPLSFYGALAEYGKGWQTFSANFASLDNGDDTQSLDLADLTDSGTGAALVKITRDAKGRISGTSSATTTDLAEGSNLYFTDERAQDAIGAALDGTGDVPLTYDDAGNKISAALSAGVLASLTLADSATQPGDLATVATTGAYADLSGLPTLGTAAATDATDYATAAQGTKADSAVQSVVAGTNVTVDNTDPQNPVISATGGGGSGDVVGPASATNSAIALFDGTTGKLLKDGGALNKAAVGLGNVDNTSDVNKPVSTAQQTALDGKANLSGGNTFSSAQTFSGNVGIGAAASAFQFEVYGPTAGLGLSRTSGEAFVQLSDSITGTVGGQMRAVITGPGLKFTRRDGGGIVWWTMPGLIPGADNTYDVGSASLRGRVAYFATGTINTSDAREKTDVAPLAAAELDAAADLARAIGTYQWLASIAKKDANNARHHVGLTVQRAIEIMQSHGLDPMRYGFICYDQWDETPEVMDPETGEVTQAYRPAGDRYSFRTDELTLFIVRGIDARLSAIEAKLS